MALERSGADAILVGEAEVDGAGVGSALGISARSTGVVRPMDPGRRSIIWSAEAGYKSAFSTFRKGGPAKIAECLIKQLAKTIKKGDPR